MNKRSAEIKRLRKRADALLQKINLREHERCEGCGGPNQVGHHYFTTGSCSELRYELLNVVPLCRPCHTIHHKATPSLDVPIMLARGIEWYQGLEDRRRIASGLLRAGVRARRNKAYYLGVIEMLEARLEAGRLTGAKA